MKRKQSFQNVALVVVAAFLALLVTEVSLRVAFGGRFGKRPGFLVADDQLGWKPAPNLDHTFYGPDFAIEVKTDADGLRLGAAGTIDFQKRLVLLAGDSNVFGWGVSSSETFASYLDEMLSPRGERVVNLGVSGYGTFESVYRAAAFLSTHGDGRIAALVFVHAPNDPADNFAGLGYQLGTWKVENRRLTNSSPSHLANFVAHAYARWRDADPKRWQRDSGEESRADQDVLWAFQVASTRWFPPNVKLNGRMVDFMKVSEEDWSQERLARRESMTVLQKEVMREAVRSIHIMAEDVGVPAFHLMTPTSPRWFVDEMTVILSDSTIYEGADVVIVGAYPGTERFTEEIFNAHSGGHYTFQFNRYWAGAVASILQEHRTRTPGRDDNGRG